MGKADFGQVLRQAREEQGLPLRELARRVGLDPSRLSRIEHGDRPPPSLPQIRALSQALGVPMADLLVAAGTKKEVLETLLWSERLSFRKEEAFVPFHPELWEKNTFPAEVPRGRGALRVVRVGEVTLEVISFTSGRLLVTLPPEAVLLFSCRPQGLGTRNLFPGRVHKVRALGELLNVVLDCPGFELNALVPDWVQEELALSVGKEAWAAIPAPAIRTYPIKEGES